jgi:hypothetical protein
LWVTLALCAGTRLNPDRNEGNLAYLPNNVKQLIIAVQLPF